MSRKTTMNARGWLGSIIRVGARACVLALALGILQGCRAEALRFRAIYVDLDGTALGRDDKVRAATVAALHAFQRAGGRVGIATGRTREQAAEAIEAIRPDLPVVLANGSEIIDLKTGRVLARRTLAAETARDVVTRVAGRDSVLGIIVHFERANVADRPAAGDLAEFASRASLRLAPSTTASIEPGDTTGRGPILKLLVVLAKPDTMRADCPCLPVTSTLADRVRDEIARDRADARVVASGPQTVEVVPITKGEAVLTALRSVGIRPSDVIAFGDSGNDLEMLQSVGFGVAMGNCRSGACEAAIARIGAHDTDAIADLVRHVALVDGHIR